VLLETGVRMPRQNMTPLYVVKVKPMKKLKSEKYLKRSRSGRETFALKF
jgi:hypothetical protein